MWRGRMGERREVEIREDTEGRVQGKGKMKEEENEETRKR